MNTDERLNTHHTTRAFDFFKWLLFGIEIFLLWVLCNTLFLVPGSYIGERGLIIGVSALLSAVVAWTSGRMFQSTSSDGSTSLGKTLSAPPVVICIFVLAVAGLTMAIALLATR